MPMEVLFYTDELLNRGVLHLPSFLGGRGYLDWQDFLEHFLVYRLFVCAIMCQEQQFLNLLNFIQICYLREKDQCSVT